jgi:hypothetical protein
MFPLPGIWSLVSKMEKLRRFSDSIPAEFPGLLKYHAVTMLSELSKIVQEDSTKDYYQKNSRQYVQNQVATMASSVIFNRGNAVQFTSYYNEDTLLDMSNGDPVTPSDIHFIGIPEQCTDIVYLLIDDLQHRNEETLHRYCRVWHRSGEAMLVSSTTTRIFNTAGNIVEVNLRCIIHIKGNRSL